MKSKQEGFKKLGLIVTAGLLAGACSPLSPSVSKLSNAAAQKTTPTDSSSPGPGATLTSAGGTTSMVATSKALVLTNGGTQVTRSTTAAQYQSSWSVQVDMKPEIDLKGNLRALSDFKNSGVARFPISDDLKSRVDTLLAKNTMIYLIVGEDDNGLAGALPAGLQVSLSVIQSDGDEPAQWQLSIAPSNSDDPVKTLDDENQAKHAIQDHLLDVVVEFDAS